MSSDDGAENLVALIIEIILIVVYNPITDTLFWWFNETLQNIVGENPAPSSSLLLWVPWILFIVLTVSTVITVIDLFKNKL